MDMDNETCHPIAEPKRRTLGPWQQNSHSPIVSICLIKHSKVNYGIINVIRATNLSKQHPKKSLVGKLVTFDLVVALLGTIFGEKQGSPKKCLFQTMFPYIVAMTCTLWFVHSGLENLSFDVTIHDDTWWCKNLNATMSSLSESHWSCTGLPRISASEQLVSNFMPITCLNGLIHIDP